MKQLFRVSGFPKLFSPLILAAFIISQLVWTTGNVSAAIIFSDGFDTGDYSAWTSGLPENGKWEIDNSGHTGKAARIKGENDTSKYLYKEISTIGQEDIVFNYWYKVTDNLESSQNDIVSIDWWDGTMWNNLFTITSVDNPPSDNQVCAQDADICWKEKTHNLPIEANNLASFKIRFLGDLGSGSDKVLIDDVSVSGLPISAEIIEDEEIQPEPTTGSIRVCKVILDAQGNAVAGTAGTTFSFSEGNLHQGVQMPATSFETPLDLNADILPFIEGEDAECIMHDNLTFQTTYLYGPETISPSDTGWDEPLYNDQYDSQISSLDDFYTYNQNIDSNGGITIEEGHVDRTFVVLNRMLEEPEDIPVAGSILAKKIVCPNESQLPNWGNSGPDITATTVDEFLALESSEGCEEVEWDFQWSLDGVGNPGDNNPAISISGWNNFADSVSVPEGRIWIREIADGDYIPFTGQNTDQPVSAEIYCATDVLHYDNWEFIDVVAGGEYHCVAFNVPLVPEEPKQCDVVSDTTNTVEGGGFAVETFTHAAWAKPSWLDTIPAAAWIWDAFHVANPAVEETKVFNKSFELSDVPASAEIEIAADNGYILEINGVEIANKITEEYSFTSTATYEVTNLIVGTNTIKITVKNFALDMGPEDNPAGVVYRLHIEDSSCMEVPPPPVCDEGTIWNGEQCIPEEEEVTHSDVTICKVDGEGNELSGWTLMLLGNNGSAVDMNISVPANDTDGVEGNVMLNGGGASYVAIANGTWLNARGEDNFVDAEYSTVDNWSTQMDGYTGYGDTILELMVNGTLGDWGAYNGNHEYARSFTLADAAKVLLGVSDTFHGDNQGSLNVSVYEGYSAITGENGCVTFEDVPVGSDYVVSEINKPGWIPDPHNPSTVTLDDETETFTLINTVELVDMCPEEGVQESEEDCIDIVPPPQSPQCSDGIDNDSDGKSDIEDPGCHTDGDANDLDTYDPDDTDESNDGDGGSTSGSIPNSSFGQVLGATTSCAPYLHEFIKLGAKNNPEEVKLLQSFLNKDLGLNLSVDGNYGPLSFGAVKQFQAKYANEVLQPWLGITLPEMKPTGWVYKTTQRWINLLNCPELNLPMPALKID